ncbi:T9SS C-terminal target domain-containing protein [Bacteroides sp. 214]|uniref:LamG-like jellyroll fold domain-containing protein n=1 Tax=Bacteroides sp. 214 TaxID=2302935 RepID=UPI0013D4938D|nr:LamG-like jellyroll fold domain-containing protein [Bacteroides sp. 214]NDW13706.1 T9SS C-terminal target domain-containing protein [Bacteroides sp. 214]
MDNNYLEKSNWRDKRVLSGRKRFTRLILFLFLFLMGTGNTYANWNNDSDFVLSFNPSSRTFTLKFAFFENVSGSGDLGVQDSGWMDIHINEGLSGYTVSGVVNVDGDGKNPTLTAKSGFSGWSSMSRTKDSGDRSGSNFMTWTWTIPNTELNKVQTVRINGKWAKNGAPDPGGFDVTKTLTPFDIKDVTLSSYSFSTDGGKAVIKFPWSKSYESGNNLDDGLGTIVLYDNINKTELLSVSANSGDAGTFVLDIANVNFDVENTYSIYRKYSGIFRKGTGNIKVPIYQWPTALNLSYTIDGYVNYSWDISALPDDKDYITGDQFELERADNKNFDNSVTMSLSHSSQTIAYSGKDDIRNNNAQGKLYYRLRRTNTSSQWGWIYNVTDSVAVKSKLMTFVPDTVTVEEKNGFPTAVIKWTYENGIWPDNSYLKIRRRNITTGQISDLVELNEEDAKAGVFYDESLIACNEMNYLIQFLPGSSKYTRPAETQIPGYALTAEIGSVSNLIVSKGYYSDRVSLQWSAVGGFDNFRIRRVEYNKQGADTIQVATVVASSGDFVIADDNKGAAGVYYTYIVDGMVTCNKKNMFSNAVHDIGFRTPTGSIYGRIKYENGQAVPYADVFLESDVPETGKSIRFNGTDAYLQLNKNLALAGGDFTLQAWVAPTDNQPANQTIMSKEGEYELGFNAEGKFSFTTGGATVVTDYVKPTGLNYTHISAVKAGGELLLYVNGEHKASVAGAAAATSTSTTYIGKNEGGNFFNGLIDEMRAWEIALTAEEIERDYGRLLYGGETGIVGYWRFNDGIAGEFYDISFRVNDHNANHGTIVNAMYNDVIPSKDQLTLKGVTDDKGNYSITGIPYYGQGTMYRVIPYLGAASSPHQFDPVQQQRLIAEGALSHTCDFTDKSSFQVTGYVYYNNSTVPVPDVMFTIDGVTAVKSNGSASMTDSDGKFDISVPVGKHEVKAVKHNHVFVNEGKITNIDGSDRNYQQRLENIHLYDSTTIKFIGRMGGGAIQAAYPLGMSLSKNNLGEELKISMQLTSGNKNKLTVNPTDSVLIIDHPVPVWEDDKSKVHQTKLVYNTTENSLDIYPDPQTGEFMVNIFPESYSISAAFASGHGNLMARSVSVDLQNVFVPQSSKHAFTDSIQHATGEVEYLHYEDSVSYNYKYNFIKRVTPSLELVQIVNNKEQSFYGDSISTANAMDGTSIKVPVYDCDKKEYIFGAPFFQGGLKYSFIMKAFEAFTFYNKEGGEVGKPDRVPVTDGVLSFNNGFSLTEAVDEVEVDSVGIAYYDFVAGSPEISTPDALKRLAISLKMDSQVVLWNDGKSLEAVVTGGKESGTKFVTRGPDQLKLILRDPHGSNSYSYIEEGFTTTTESFYVFSIENEGSEYLKAHNGGKIVTFAGVGAGMIKEVEVPNEQEAGIIHKESVSVKTGTVEEQTFTTRFQTSDDPLYVGADGDVYIGNSTNISYGEATCIYLIEAKQFSPEEHTELKRVGDYVLVRAEGLNIGMDYSTMFAYPQAFIENTLIPELQRMRNTFILPYTVGEAGAKARANSTGKQVYWSQVQLEDEEYDIKFGADNRDRDIFGDAASEKYEDGPSYKIIVPDGELMDVDTVLTYNQQVETWIGHMRKNEEAKVRAKHKKNYSFHAGAPIEYSEEFSHKRATSEEFNIGLGLKAMSSWGMKSDGQGLSFVLEETGYINNGGSFEQSNEQKKSIGFVFADEGSTDYLSVDVCTDVSSDFADDDTRIEGSSNFIFKLKGGATSCPYEDGYITKYYEPGKHVIDQATAQVEVPVLDVENANVTNVPSSRRAVYKLYLSNGSEINTDCSFDLNVVDASNPNGASFYIDGTPLGNGRTFTIPAKEVLIKTLEVGKGTELDYPDLQLVLHSQCQYNTLDFKDNIGDTITIAAHFVPSCSDVHISQPSDKWTLYDSTKFRLDGKADGDFCMPMLIDGYDTNYANFKCIRIMYKPSAASDNDWESVIEFYADEALREKAEGATEMIKKGGSFTYNLNMQKLPDQKYDICAVSVCLQGTTEIETFSNIVSGVKDTYRPRLFGSAQPANGILDIDSEVRLNFNESIAEGLLSDNCFEVTGTRNGQILSRAASVHFDGKSDYLETEIVRNLTSKNFTAEMALMFDKLGESVVFSHGNINNSFELGFTADKRIAVKIGSDIVYSDETIDLPLQEWVHLAAVYSAGNNPQIVVYYNMKQVINKSTDSYNGEGNYVMGRSISTENKYFCGKMSELRVWDRPLSMGTLNQNRSISLKGSEPGLIAYYPMDEGRGTVAKDKARGANALMHAQWFIDRSGFAAKFDGQSYVKLSTGSLPISDVMDYTLDFWFKAQPGQTDAAMVANGRGDGQDNSGSTNLIFIGFEDGKLVLRNNGYKSTLEEKFDDGAWHHYALTVSRNFGRASIYVDGMLKTYFDASSLGGIKSAYMHLGARAWYSETDATTEIVDMYFKGGIDEFRIWETYKNETLINMDNNVSLKGTEMALFTYYPFEEYQSWQGTKEMVFSLSDKTIRGANGAVVNDAIAKGDVSEKADVAPVKDKGAENVITVNYVVNNDALIITPAAANGWDDYEESIVSFRVKDVQDVNGNTIISPISWTAYIDRNQLQWNENEVNVSKDVYEPLEFTVDIINVGGSVERFSIENAPSWLTVYPSSGSINPKSTLHLKFTVDEALNIGSYDEIIYLMNENNVARALNLNVKVKGEKPNWKVNPADFKYNMSVYGKLRINNIFSSDKDDMIAAFVDGKCVGVANCQYQANVDMWYTFLVIYGNDKQKDGIEFRIWDDSTGRIYLAKTSSGNIPFINNSIVGSSDEPVIFSGEEMVYQNMKLNRGWNWISLNLNASTLGDLNTALANGTWTSASEVKNDVSTSSYSVNTKQWVGSLKNFNNTTMYMLNSSSEQVLSLFGTAVNAREVSINVGKNWNYISYLPTENMTIKEALSEYSAVKGDVVKSQSGFAMYSENSGWIGNLTYMEAGKGYMLYRDPSAAATSFRYPAIQGSLTRAAETAATRANADEYENLSYAENMTVVAVSHDNMESGDRIVAYVNGELRGVGSDVAEANATFITIAGEQDGVVTFGLERNGTIVARANETFNYSSDKMYGSLDKPMVLNFADLQSGVKIYPSPFETELSIVVSNPEVETVEVTIYDVQGRVVYKIEKETVYNGYYRKVWNATGLERGTYLVQVTVNGESTVHKVEKK